MRGSPFPSSALARGLLSAALCLLPAQAARGQPAGPIRIGYALARTGPFAAAALSIGPQLPMFKARMGPSAGDVMGVGAWNARASPGAKAYFEAYKARHQREPDRLGSDYCWAALEILEQAVEKVGLDRAAIRDYIAANEFQTVVGPIRFRDGENVSTPGMVGQWQQGEFEVVWPPARATAQPVFPKQAWR